MKEAVAETGATASCVFIPAPGVADAVFEAAEAGIEFIVVITEGVPPHDEARFYNRLKRDFPAVQLLGPNCPGIISPGKCNIGITAGEIALAGGPVGIVSRSGTLTYQALNELTQRGHRRRRPASASAATPYRARASSTASSASRPTPRPRP